MYSLQRLRIPTTKGFADIKPLSLILEKLWNDQENAKDGWNRLLSDLYHSEDWRMDSVVREKNPSLSHSGKAAF